MMCFTTILVEPTQVSECPGTPARKMTRLPRSPAISRRSRYLVLVMGLVYPPSVKRELHDRYVFVNKRPMPMAAKRPTKYASIFRAIICGSIPKRNGGRCDGRRIQ